MNIFAVDNDPVLAAQALHDRHVVKMCLETAQILCTVAHGLGIPAPYKPTHKNHPCTLWAGNGENNAYWLWRHGMALCDEYTYRFGKVHACEQVIRDLQIVSYTLPRASLTPFAQVMPDEYRSDDAVDAYRRMYRATKVQGNRWTKREPPAWLEVP